MRQPVLGSAVVDVCQPKLTDLPPRLLEAVREVGDTLAANGHSSWVVGGAVRDLCAGRKPSEVDLTTDASPDEVEACFGSTVPLGKRFGTVLVKTAGLGIEVTTLRAEGGYEDSRRPNEVVFGTSVEEDAARRDFTCNAMYLDTQGGEFLDPVQGMKDLAQGALVAVGDPSLRFLEDGLRIFRLARFAATLEMKPSRESLEGARRSIEALRGVSGERMMVEFSRAFSEGSGLVMLRLLSELGVHEHLFPAAQPGASKACVAACNELKDPPSLVMGLLLFMDPDPLDVSSSGRAERSDQALESLARFRPSRDLKAEFLSAWRLCAALEQAAHAPPDRGQLLLWMREPAWDTACALGVALRSAQGSDPGLLLEWDEERSGLSDEDLFPAPWIGPAQLAECGLPKGPRWGEVLSQALRLQLSGELSSASDAMAWLRAELEA